MKPSHYVYSEDSRLLGEFLSSIDDSGAILEIGTGNGGNLSLIHQRGKFQLIVGTDLMPLFYLRDHAPKDVELIQADKASCFRPASFDLVVFNPPYVPSDVFDDITVDGGRGGIEKPLEFLSSALSVVRRDGKIAMVLSSEDSIAALESYCESLGLFSVKVLEAKLFFESLFVYLITKINRDP